MVLSEKSSEVGLPTGKQRRTQEFVKSEVGELSQTLESVIWGRKKSLDFGK